MIELKSADANEVWESIKDWVKSSLGSDKSFIVNDVKESCLAGECNLWVISKDDEITGFLTTTINEAPQGRVCYCPWLGGENLAEWVPEGFEQLKNHLRGEGCLSVSWMGRAAWQKMIKVDSTQCFYSINL